MKDCKEEHVKMKFQKVSNVKKKEKGLKFENKVKQASIQGR